MKASYERILHPPPGLISSRQVDYGAISPSTRPMRSTVVFHLKWPDAAMLANFASPWNCIYSAARLAEDPHVSEDADPRYRAVRVRGAREGDRLARRALHNYFEPGSPYLDAYQADFIPPGAVIGAYKSGKIMAEFRGVTPPQRDELVETLGDKRHGEREPVALEPARRLQHAEKAVRRRARAPRALARDRPLGCRAKTSGHDVPQICRRADAAGLGDGDAGVRARLAAGLLA